MRARLKIAAVVVLLMLGGCAALNVAWVFTASYNGPILAPVAPAVIPASAAK